MRKPILMMLLAVVSSSAAAEWTLLGKAESLGGYQIYLDISTVRGSGNLVRVWELYDYQTMQMDTAGDRSYFSAKLQSQYDCQEEQVRGLALSQFSKNMGGGSVVFSGSDKNGQWEPVEPGSWGETIFKIVCDKK